MSFDNGYTNAIFCTNCGARVHHGDSYCPVCGCRIGDYSENSSQNAQPVNVDNTPQVIVQEKESKSSGRTIGIIGTLLVIASVFLPYISYSVLGFGESMSLMDSEDGIFFLIGAVIALLLFCVKSKVLSLLISIGMAVLCFIEYQASMDTLYELGALAGFVDKEIGFYLIIIGAVFMLLGAVINSVE